jgi:pilus assembly protein CpaC
MAVVAATLFAPLSQPVAEKGQARAGFVGPEERRLTMELNKGQLVRLGARASSVFIADPTIADVQVKSPTLVYVFGKKAGETTLFAVDGRDRILANLRITVSHNLSNLQKALKTLYPRSYIEAITVGDSVMLSGTVRSASVAEDARTLAARYVGDEKKVLNRLSVRGPSQVSLRVRVAEVNRAVIKKIGINWEALVSIGSFAFGVATGFEAVNAAGQFLILNDSTDSGFASVRTGALNINAVLDALASEGLLSVLAEPNLTAISGQTASFLAGGEFPILVPEGDNRISIQFKQFGVSLAFTPTVTHGGRISLKVRPEVSQLSELGEVRLENVVVPGIRTRRAETTVELGSGQSFAVAGLIQNNTSHDVRKFPGLGELPILGPLFRSDEFRRNETELVIIVTPYIVRPVSAPLLAAPTDGLRAPTDEERYFDGAPAYRPEVGTGKAAIRPRRGSRLVGSAGFALD